MQSSSELFPVALLSAELRGALSEDVYLLKPGKSSDPSVELALTRLGHAQAAAPRGVPVILLHGSFSNRRFWYSPHGLGVGPYLAALGFDVWLAEMRGHGLSPRNREYRHNRLSDYARDDLPAIAAFVMEQTGQQPHWVGHSMGGTTLAAALGGGYLAQEQVASVALFGSQVSRTYWPLKVPPVEWLLRGVLGRFEHLSGVRLKRGPEDEPTGLLKEAVRIHGLFGRFGDAQSDWWAGLSQVQVPLLAVAGGGDEQDPEWACRALFEQFGSTQRRFLCLGLKQGFSADYGHIDMLVSKPAQQEVWPLLGQWLSGALLDMPEKQAK